ncbi:hypothetical protein T265_03492 [Opisthorchis viverrini]|uniref:Uncharacterized protein n=1 Tax=Opisthorchis viverrini TaxID=6198 RepID=A0A074ZRG0_OPIVI|nr:hypothetical protein T265_03492 [Opisthorchis viverrini]KER30013.1 hypothetical protein T265_03492 [Opisthorchis viverrini]
MHVGWYAHSSGPNVPAALRYLAVYPALPLHQSISCSTLSVPSCHATRKRDEGWDTAWLPKPIQGKSRGRAGWVRTTDLLWNSKLTDATLFPATHGREYRLNQASDLYYVKLEHCTLSGLVTWKLVNKSTEREFTDRKVRGLNPTSASRLPLPRLGQPDSIPALMLPLGSMSARYRMGVTPEGFSLSYPPIGSLW